MVAKKHHNEEVQVLTDREHVRLRTPMYLGSTVPTTFTVPVLNDDSISFQNFTFVPAVLRALCEIIENSMDEMYRIEGAGKSLHLTANTAVGFYAVEDNGRGIPIDMHSTGRYTPEVALSMLRAGRNFTSNKTEGTQGQNGVGSACTNYCSKSFKVIIHRDNKCYRQEFTDGAAEVTTPSITRKISKETGTRVEFTLDPAVFPDTSLPEQVIINKAKELALMNPGLKVTLGLNGTEYKFMFKDGLAGYLINVFKKKKNGSFFKFEDDHLETYVIAGASDIVENNVYTWVNSAYLFDGGTCNSQVANYFYNKVIDQLSSQAKKAKIVITKEDVGADVLLFSNFKVSDPLYDSQAKVRFKGPDLKRNIEKMIEAQWEDFAKKNKAWFNEVFERAKERYNRKADQSAGKEFKKKVGKVEGLLEATSDDRMSCILLVTEGDSAASQISEARDPKTVASLPLSGKINNVYGCSIAQLLTMVKVADLIKAIGLVPGQKAVRSELRYGSLGIATDADPDGDGIFTLIVNIFYRFWPELLRDHQNPFIHRLVAPNIVASKKNTRVHFANRREFELVQDKYAGYDIEYMKGLGSMNLQDWKQCLVSKKTLTPVLDDGNLGKLLSLCFSDNSDNRKLWLMGKDVEGSCRGSRTYLEECYLNFSLYTITNRALLYSSDGLRDSIRRTLWTSRTLGKTKTSSVAGATMPIHPHGEADNVIQNYAAPYKTNYPLFKGYSGFGTLMKPDAYAAPRYTSVEVSEFSRDAVFVDMKLIPMKPNYDHTREEPAHLLPLVPLHLINSTQGLSVGFKCDVWAYDLNDVINDMLAALKGKKITQPMAYFKPIDNRACEKLVSPSGNTTWVFKGEVEQVKAHNYRITKLPCGMYHADAEKKLDALVEKGDLIRVVDDSSDKIDIVVTFARAVSDKFENDDDVIRHLGLVSRLTEHLNFIDFDGVTVISTSYEEVIQNFTKWRFGWYLTRYELEMDELEDDLIRVLDHILTIELLQKKKIHFDKHADRSALVKQLDEYGIINVDYIAQLPSYRYTQDEYARLQEKKKVLLEKIHVTQELIDSEEKRKDVFVTELKQIQKKHCK